MLPWDQVPPERREIGDLAAPLDEELGVMRFSLAIWMARDDSKADDGKAPSSAVRAGNQVMDSIDVMLDQLHRLRARMVAERRVNEDIAAARAGTGQEATEENDDRAYRPR